MTQFPIRCERARQALTLASPRRRAHAGDHRDLIQDDGRILDEDAVGKIRFRGQYFNVSAEFGQAILILTVLLDGQRQVDGLAIQELQLAVRDRRADLTGNRPEHLWIYFIAACAGPKPPALPLLH